MHKSRQIALLQPELVIGIAACYEAGEDAPRETFKMLRSDAANLQKNDYIICESDARHHMSVLRVEEVDVEIDLESRQPLKWVIARIDRTAFNALQAEEAKMQKTIRDAQQRKKAAELRATVVADLEQQDLDAIRIGFDSAPTPPPKMPPAYDDDDDMHPI